ncbi:MAG: alpha/beta fold hydrolase [Phycisphaerae bacterium]|jgi:pimeloyl-ACP methyl ester carboxylesterase
MFYSKGGLLRYTLLIVSLAIWLFIGRFFLAMNSVIDLVHFSSIPLVLSYLLIFRPPNIKKSFMPYGFLFIFITLLVTAYLIAFSKTMPHVRINWAELPIAVYFLLSVYAILWLLDKFINRILLIVLGTNQKNKITKNTAKTVFRFAILIFAVIPYLVAVFTTHWIKFTDAASPKKLMDMEYRQVYFNAKDGARLDGWFIPSSTRVSDSSVIIVPGRSPTKNLFLSYAKILSDTGYNVFLFDLRGNGNSSGHKYSFGIDEAGDVLGAIDYLKNNRPESSRYVFGFGINEGASALIAAASEDERFTGVVIDNASGYDVSLPEWVSDYLPGWMEKTLSKTIRSIVFADIGQSALGTEGLYEKISQISPCPVLVANSFKSDKSGRQETVDLYTKAKNPKMLWLTPPQTEEGFNIGTQQQYFQNILELFEFGRAKQQSGRWRISRNG